MHQRTHSREWEGNLHDMRKDLQMITSNNGLISKTYREQWNSTTKSKQHNSKMSKGLEYTFNQRRYMNNQ